VIRKCSTIKCSSLIFLKIQYNSSKNCNRNLSTILKSSVCSTGLSAMDTEHAQFSLMADSLEPQSCRHWGLLQHIDVSPQTVMNVPHWCGTSMMGRLYKYKERVCEKPLLSSQFCCEPKTALKIKSVKSFKSNYIGKMLTFAHFG
jgi:hypothetical protein